MPQPRSPFERLSILSLTLIDALQRGATDESIELLQARGHEIERLKELNVLATDEEFGDLACLDAEIQGQLMQARQGLLREMVQLSKQNAVAQRYRTPTQAQTVHVG